MPVVQDLLCENDAQKVPYYRKKAPAYRVKSGQNTGTDFLALGLRVVLSPSQQLLRESFCESGEGVRLPRDRADLRGSPGNFRGNLGNFRGSLGNLRGTLGLLLSSTVSELPGNSPKNFRGSLGNFRGSPGTFQKLGVA